MTGESRELKKEKLEISIQRAQEEAEDAELLGAAMERTSHRLPSPVMLSGTEVRTGEGVFMVIAVGSRSCLGKVIDKLEQTAEETPLQKKLD